MMAWTWTCISVTLTLLCFITMGLNSAQETVSFVVVREDRELSANSPETVSVNLPGDMECAVKCVQMGGQCRSFSFSSSTSTGSECRISSSSSPTHQYKPQSKVFEPQSLATTAAACTDPFVSSAANPCTATHLSFQVSAMMRLYSSRALVFTTDNDYFICSSMNQISEQAATQCSGPYPITGDAGLDPFATWFESGPPDAAVEHLASDPTNNRYFLFKDNLVHCYKDAEAKVSKIKRCPGTSWANGKNIANKFGEGIPSNVDAVIASRDNSALYHFIKDNMLYESVAESLSGPPRHIHMDYPEMPCNVSAGMVGQNSGEMYYTRGTDFYLASGGTVVNKGSLCYTDES